MASASGVVSQVVNISPTVGSFSLTVPTGTDILVFGFVGSWADIGSIAIGAASGVLTRALESDGNLRALQLWHVVAPPTGAQTVQLRRASGSTGLDYRISVLALSGIDTTTPLRSGVTSLTATGTIGERYTTQAGDVAVTFVANDNALTPTASQTDTFNGTSAAQGAGQFASSFKVASGTTTDITYSTTNSWPGIIGAAFAATSTPTIFNTKARQRGVTVSGF